MTIAKVLATTLTALAVGIGSANAACQNAQDALNQCWNDFTDAAPNVFTSDDAPDRVQTVGDAVRDCWTCATNSLSNMINDFNTNDDPPRTDIDWD